MCRLWEIRIGFKSKRQGPLFMVWKLYYLSEFDRDPDFGSVLSNSRDWIGV